VPAVLWITRQK